MFSKILGIFILLFSLSTLFAQKSSPNQTKVSGYIGVVHPIYTFQQGRVKFNFQEYYQMGITTAVIVRKSEKYAFNLELVGFVRSENGLTKANNFLLHPGISFYLNRNWTLTPRIGIENNGRFGNTLIVSRTLFRVEEHPINFNLVNLLRFGNEQGPSFTQAVNLTFGF